ncbi:unnamed protein product, partial [Polarella glacialis]
NPAALEGLASPRHVAWLSDQRSTTPLCKACPSGAAGERRQLLSTSSASGLTAGESLAQATSGFRPGALGLHRQTWLNRLATRFESG